MNRSRGSVLIVMAVLLSYFCLSPIVLAQEAAANDDNIVGEWDIKYSARGRQSTAKLLITKKNDDTLAGVWTSGRGASDLEDLKFEAGTLTFLRRFSIQGREMSMAFTGKIEGGGLTGEFVSSRGNTPVSGTPSGAAVVKPSFPVFSWDMVPIYIHFGKSSGFTDEEIEFVATHSDYVCLEKGHGSSAHGSTEKGIEHDAARLKAVNPDMKIIYYWNTFLDYPMYDAHDVYESHPEWWLYTLDGSLDLKKGKYKRYDLSNPDVREWWTEEVKKAVVEGSCDGVFMDAFPQIANSSNIALWGQEKYDSIQDGLIETILLTREKTDSSCILMYNGIRNTPSLHFGMQYLDITDASKIEHFDQFASRDKENIVLDIENMIEAGKKGQIVVMKAWPGFNWLDPIRGVPYGELLVRARENITFPLACFLVAAQPYSYFCYSWGYRENYGSLDWYEEFDKPVGPPKGDAVRNGWQYTREFEHCKVWVNLETKEAKIDWN